MAQGDLFFAIIRTRIEDPGNTGTYRCRGWIKNVSRHEADNHKLLISHVLCKDYSLANRSICDVPIGSEVVVKESKMGAYFIERVTKEQSVEAPDT